MNTLADNEQALASSLPVTTTIESSIAGSSWLEIGLVGACLLVVLFALFAARRRVSNTVYFLLGGFFFLMLKSLLFLWICWAQPQMLWPDPLAGYCGAFGWTLIFLYCASLLMARPTDKT